MSQDSTRKAYLHSLLEDEEDETLTKEFVRPVAPASFLPFRNRTNQDMSTASNLDTSTVPTYEEFITKTTKTNNLNKFLLNSTHANTTVIDGGLVTDDDSSSSSSASSDEDEDKTQQYIPKQTPKARENDENHLMKQFDRMSLVKNVTPKPNTPLLGNRTGQSQQLTPKNLLLSSLKQQQMRNSPQKEMGSPGEYVVHACISTQTSFTQSPAQQSTWVMQKFKCIFFANDISQCIKIGKFHKTNAIIQCIH